MQALGLPACLPTHLAVLVRVCGRHQLAGSLIRRSRATIAAIAVAAIAAAIAVAAIAVAAAATAAGGRLASGLAGGAALAAAARHAVALPRLRIVSSQAAVWWGAGNRAKEVEAWAGRWSTRRQPPTTARTHTKLCSSLAPEASKVGLVAAAAAAALLTVEPPLAARLLVQPELLLLLLAGARGGPAGTGGGGGGGARRRAPCH